MILTRTLFALFTLVLVQGCVLLRPDEVVQPSEVTLEEALTSVGRGLRRMHEAQGGLKTGLVPTEVSVSFNLGVSAKDSSKLTLDFSRAFEAAVKKESKAGLEAETSSEGSRANVITVKFVNLLALPESSIVHKKSAAEVKELINALQESDITILFSIPGKDSTR
jgi:hypothetical protein